MGTVYIPTKADQDAANTKMTTLQAKMDAMEQSMASASMATITVRFNWTGQTYDVPSSASVIAEILNGAKIVLNEQGLAHPYEAQITSLTNFSTTFTVFVTSAAKLKLNSIGAVLGTSTSAGYTVAMESFLLTGGSNLTVYLNMRLATGTTVEVFRAQPYVANPGSSSTARLNAGNSYLGTRIKTGTGTTINFGHWTNGETDWVDQSLTKVSLWDCPADGSTPTERVITTAADTTGWVSLDDRLNCIKNIIIGTLTYTGDSATVGGNKIVRYDPLWVKQTRENVNMPIADANGNLVDNYVDCIVRWYANSQVDANYHLHPLFEKYERRSDGSYTATACAHGYIARYPIGNTTSLTIDGNSWTVPQWQTGNGNQYVPGNRSVTLGICRMMNKCTANLYFDDDGDGTEELFATIQPDSDNRTFGVAGTAEISFLQWMSYLYFGVNVQGAASTTTPDDNIFPGICTSSVAATTNGATDHIVSPTNHATWGFKVWNGAVNTKLCTNSIVFMGVEDALWSSTGWYWEDVTLVTRRAITTDATGAVTSNVASTGWLFAQDGADVEPGSTDKSYETTIAESASYEGRLKAAGYRCADFDGRSSGGYWYRSGVDSSQVLRDACLPASVADQSALNCGAADYYWRGGTPDTFGNFSPTASYTNGDFCFYDNGDGSKLYECTATHSGAWDASHFTLFASQTVTRRSYWLVALGYHRSVGSSLGSFFVVADDGLTSAGGHYWRARPFLHTVS